MASTRSIPGTARLRSAVSGILSRLGWRTLLLRDPRRYADDRSEIAGSSSPLRPLLLAEAERLPIRRRFRLVARRGGSRLTDELLLQRLRTAPDGCRYFDLDGDRIHFAAGRDQANDDALLAGVLNILHEAYFEPQEFLKHGVTAGPGDVVLDLGGNVGTSALFFSEMVGPAGRVYSFEPVFPEALARTVAESGARNVRTVPLAVGDERGRVPFSLHTFGIDSGMATHDDRSRVRMVEMTTLDEFVETEGLDRVDVIKLDIEGAEELALDGGRATLRRFRPRLTIASYHTDSEGRRQHPRLVWLLRSLEHEVREEDGRRIYAW